MLDYSRHLVLPILTYLIVSAVNTVAQPSKGKISFFQDSRIPALVQKNVQYNSRQRGTLDGYRVQIFFDSGSDSKKRAMDSRSEFLAKYPEIPAYLTFQEPFYKVRVGDFRLRIEADGFLERLRNDYPNGFTVKDRINFPKVD